MPFDDVCQIAPQGAQFCLGGPDRCPTNILRASLGRVPSSARLVKGEAILSKILNYGSDLENGPLEFLHFLHAATKSNCKNYFLLAFFDGLPVRYPPAP